jgi:hypothetical protein
MVGWMDGWSERVCLSRGWAEVGGQRSRQEYEVGKWLA